MATLDFWLNIGFRAAWIKVAGVDGERERSEPR